MLLEVSTMLVSLVGSSHFKSHDYLDDGSGGDSIYNGKFNDEKPGLAKKFDAKGIVAMANSGKNSNTSQFFITLSDKNTKQLEKLNGKYTIFGKVIEGFEALDAVNGVDVEGETPSTDIQVVKCGEL